MKKVLNYYFAAALLAACAMASCSDSGDAPEASETKVNLEVSVRSAGYNADGTLQDSDLVVNSGYVLIFDKDGGIQHVGVFDELTHKFFVTVPEGTKHMLVIANPCPAMVSDLLKKVTVPVEDGNGGFVNRDQWTTIKPTWAEFYPLLAMKENYLKWAQANKSVCQIADQSLVLKAQGDESTTVSLQIKLQNPTARLDVFARCPSGSNDANMNLKHVKLRAVNVPASMPWELTIPASEDEVSAEWKDVTGRVIKVDNVFDDWSTVTVDPTKPLGTLYTYASTDAARFEVGLWFEGQADYEWHEIDFKTLLPDYVGFEAGHLYQIYLTFYPDKFGHIYVNAWVDRTLTFVIG